MKNIKLLLEKVVIVVAIIFMVACSSVCERKGHDYYIEINRNGTHSYICFYDSSHYKIENCIYSEWEVILEPQEFSEGVETRYCTKCNYTEERIIPALHVHEYSDYWIIDKEATMDEVGRKSHHCLKEGCNAQINITEIPILLYSDGLIYELNNDGDGYVVSSVGECIDDNIKITPVYKNLPVIGIEANAFSNCLNLKNIEIPNSIKMIDDNAFSNCPLLTDVVIPDSVIYIGKSIFVNCNTLSSISIPYIGDKLTDSKATRLGYLFNDGSDNSKVPTSLLEVNVTKAEILGLEAFSGCKYLTNIILPDTLKYIEKDAFSNCASLREIIIPSGVISIGDYCFYNCSNLIEIEIPKKINFIGKAILLNCESISKISIPFIGSQYNDEEYTNLGYFFNDWSNNIYIPISLKEVVLTWGQRIEDGAFANCQYIETITMTPSIISIGESAFSNCESLKEIIIPINVLNIGNSAFENCIALTNIIISETVLTIGDNAFSNCQALKEIFIPNSVENIGESILKGCNTIGKITIPFIGSKIDDEDKSFLSYYFNKELDNSKIPSTLTEVTVNNGNKIYNESFFGCMYLVNIKIFANITSIGRGAFFDCKSLEEINIPDTVEIINDVAFYNCTSLKNIKLSNSLINIGNAAFYNCASLQEIIVPNNVKTIGESTFEQCTSLKKITISNSVLSVGNNAFIGCSIEIVYFSGTIEEYEKISFGEEYSNLKNYSKHVYVLDSNNEYYEIKKNNFENVVTPDE